MKQNKIEHDEDKAMCEKILADFENLNNMFSSILDAEQWEVLVTFLKQNPK